MPDFRKLEVAAVHSREAGRREERVQSGGMLSNRLSTIVQRLRSRGISPVTASESTRQKPPASLRGIKDSEIRLIHLEPRKRSEGKILCRLEVVNLDGAQYEALSYEWGPISPKNSITVDGTDTLVRKNLACALQHLQLENDSRVLWIDALCINQDNLGERCLQVALMDRIYSSATRCIAWIGPESTIHNVNSKLAIEFLNNIYQGIVNEDYSKDLSPQGRKEHDSFERFCERRYWERLWIIQEVLLPSDVVIQCGSKQISWKVLDHVFNSMELFVHRSYHFSISQSTPYRLNLRRNDRGHGVGIPSLVVTPTPPPLKDLILEFKGSKCEDYRDHVFGLLSLAPNCCRQAVPARYDISPAQLHMTLLSHHILYHLQWSISTGNAQNLTRDVEALWETILPDQIRRYSPRENDASIASGSMNALAAPPIIVSPRNHGEQVSAGKFIWIVPAVSLQEAFWVVQRVSSGDILFRTLGRSPGHLLKLLLNNVDCFINSHGSNIDLRGYYSSAHQWANPVDYFPTQRGNGYPVVASESNAPTAQPPTQLFLTDMGFSGAAVSGVELGHYACK